MQALSQLSYTPESKTAFYTDFFRRCKCYFVGLLVTRSVTRSLGNRRIHGCDWHFYGLGGNFVFQCHRNALKRQV